MGKGITDKPFDILPRIYMCRKMNKHFNLLNMNEETRKVFLQRPIASFYSHEISDYLMRTNLCSLDKMSGSAKCGRKWCKVCMNLSRLNKFTSNVTRETNNINHKLDYDDNCLIHHLSCKYCSKRSLESFVKKVACIALAFQQYRR